ncbi:MAG: cell division protein FtsZ, partial [Thermoplasmata archaeon]
MKSVVEEVLSRAGEETIAREAPTELGGFSADDEELERILAELKTNIRIIGVGGGGSNTIDRLVGAGVLGAELYAANTDAQHLLTIRS